MSGTSLVVVTAGLRTTVQDRGRPGLAHLGIGRSGALDAPALALANRLVGNDPADAGLEITLGGCALRPVGRAVTVAVTGAPCEIRVGRAPAAWGVPVVVPEGTALTVGPPSAGVRSYLAVGGGVRVAPVLGSRSTDSLSGLGPAPVRAGDVLPVGSPTAPAPVNVAVCPTVLGDLRVPVRLGPRADWLTDDSRALLTRALWTVGADSDRVGVRLSGPPLRRATAAELPSEGVVLGAVQVPPDGQPVVFLADHPTTGGYPVVAVVDERGVAGLAQARPGTAVRLVAAWDRAGGGRRATMGR